VWLERDAREASIDSNTNEGIELISDIKASPLNKHNRGAKNQKGAPCQRLKLGADEAESGACVLKKKLHVLSNRILTLRDSSKSPFINKGPRTKKWGD